MSGYIGQQDYWNQDPQSQQGQDNYNFEVPVQDFGQELNFQSFDSAAAGENVQSQNIYGGNPYLNPSAGGYTGGSFYTPSEPGQNYGTGDEFEDEPPLLEELGINPEFILQKTLTVLNPFRTPDLVAVQDTDYAGPLAFCLGFGGFLLLSGKVHFSYIYGFGAFGCLLMWGLLSLMSAQGKVTIGTVVTVLGYCLLPMVALSGVNVVFSLQGYVGTVLTAVAILWCSLSASKLFVTALVMEHQQPLVWYPCALLYGVFALITVF